MRFSSKSGQNIGIHMFSGAFLEKPVFHFRLSEASFIISPVATGDMSPVATGERLPGGVPGPPPRAKGSHLPRLRTKSSLREFARRWR